MTRHDDVTLSMRSEMGRYARSVASHRGADGTIVAGRVAAWLGQAVPKGGITVAEVLDPTCEDVSGNDGTFACSRCGATGTWLGTGRVGHCPCCGARVVRRGREDLLGQGEDGGVALSSNEFGTTVWRWRRKGPGYVADVAWLAGIDDLEAAEGLAGGITQADVIWTLGEYGTRDEAEAAAREAFERSEVGTDA